MTTVKIGKGDNSPPPTWLVAGTIAGPFELDVQIATGQGYVLRSDDGGLVFDPVSRLLSWPITVAQSDALPTGKFTTYRLRESVPVPGGEVRTVAAGVLDVILGPVDAAVAQTVVIGPSGPPPSSDVLTALIADSIAAQQASAQLNTLIAAGVA